MCYKETINQNVDTGIRNSFEAISFLINTAAYI